MSEISQPLQVHCNYKKAAGSCRIEFYTTIGASLQGIKMFALTLFGAILSIVLPGLHFITVPVGILASPFVGAYIFFTRKGAMKKMIGEFLCPQCQAHNHVAFRVVPPYFGNCVQCGYDFQVVPLQPNSLSEGSNSMSPPLSE